MTQLSICSITVLLSQNDSEARLILSTSLDSLYVLRVFHRGTKNVVTWGQTLDGKVKLSRLESNFSVFSLASRDYQKLL